MLKKLKLDNNGFIPMLITLLLIVLIVIALAFYRVVTKK
jgi:hypothetical protein